MLKNYIELLEICQLTVAKAYLSENLYVGRPYDVIAAGETVKIYAAYDSLPVQLAKDNKKFQYKLIKQGD